MKTLFQIGLFVWLFSISLNCSSQGKIDKSKDELKKGSKSSERQSNKSSSFSSGRSDDSFEFFIFRMFAEAFVFVTYNTLIGSYEKEGHLHNELTNSPFYDGFAGNYVGSGFDPPSTKNFRIDLDNKLLYYNDKLFGNHLKAKIRPIKYFYFQTDFVQLLELDEDNRDYSNISLFDLNFCYDRVRLERFNLGWILGVKYIGNDIKRAGLNYGLNTDIFISHSLSLYSSMKWSLIKNVAVNEFEIDAKFHRKNHFFSVGYEHFKIGTPNYDLFSLGGGIYF